MAEGIFQVSHLAKPVALGIVILIVALLIGAGGGFKVLFGVGGLMAKIPIWFWLLIGVVWLLNQARK